ncbi:MAG: redoxin domain-containing protein [Rubricoccaceae bacterium]|nr:redoxin domain-containing protein [Rubricoccaceae bacterium]
MIDPGQSLDPDTPVTAVHGDDTRETTLGDLLDRPTVISVYMANNTGSCDRQMAALADAADAIHDRGFDILGVSKNTPTSHARYAQKLGIDFALLSDPDHHISKAADAIVPKKMRGKEYTGPARAAYVVDADGTVLAVIPKVDAANHGQQVLDTLDALDA